MYLARAICTLAVALLLSGCGAAAVRTPATQGKAYIFKVGLFTVDVYSCDASQGEPECWEVVEQKTVVAR